MQTGMKIAQTTKRYLASMGYRVDLRPFHKHQLWLLFERPFTLFLQLVYVLHVAKTSREYMESIFMLMVGILMYVSLVSTIIKMPTIFILIDDMERVINQSEFFTIYSILFVRCAGISSSTFIIIQFQDRNTQNLKQRMKNPINLRNNGVKLLILFLKLCQSQLQYFLKPSLALSSTIPLMLGRMLLNYQSLYGKPQNLSFLYSVKTRKGSRMM